MKVIIVKNYKELSAKASEIISNRIIDNNSLILGLATGSTPKQTYINLINMYKNNKISFKNVTTFNLDEYIGLDINNKKSYNYFMYDNLFNHIDINKEKVFIPIGLGNIEKNSKEFENNIKRFGPIDLQLLGLGENGHIGFNEPGCDENSKTRKVNLTKSTIEVNERFFSSIDKVPRYAISMGIGTIMKAKTILLLASGSKKSKAVQEMIEGKITKDVPASFLQKHNNVIVIIDKEASKLLKKTYNK